MFTKKYIYFILLIIFGNTICLQAQYVLVSAKLDSNTIEIGDQVYLNLIIEKSSIDQVNFPKFKDTIVKGLEILEILPADTQLLKNNRQILTKKIKVTAFEQGIISIPAFAFNNQGDTLFSNSLELIVNQVKMDSAEIAKIDTSQVFDVFDIKGPIDTPFTFREFIQRFYPYILGLFGLALLTALILFYLRRRAQNKPLIPIPEKPKEPPHIIALRALELLKSKKLWQSGFEKEYYLELTDIIRKYIEDRFGVHTFERTSQEILETIKIQKILENNVYNDLSTLLTLADLAKFAKYKPLPNENDLCMKNANQFVENTKVMEKIPEVSGEELSAVLESVHDKSIDSQKV